MKIPYDYPTAFSHWGIAEARAIERVRASGRYTMGPEVALFEMEYAEWHGMRYCVMCNSGSSANLLMTEALFHIDNGRPLQAGDKALVPALAWATTYAPLVQRGLDLYVIDADKTWNADPYGDAAGHITDDVKLVVICSILGNPAWLETWRTIAGVIDAYVIEDNCESLGARGTDGRLCGTAGLMSSSSFFWSHQLSAIEGGAVLTNDEHLRDLLRMLRDHGMTRSVQKAEDFDHEYDFRLMGYNLRPLEMHAAVAREQLRKLPEFIEQRRINSRLFRTLTQDIPVEHPDEHGQMSPFGLQFILPPGTRKGVATALRAAGIDCRPPTGGSLGRHAYGARWAHWPTPVADRIHVDGMFIGNPPFPAPSSIEQAASVIRGALEPSIIRGKIEPGS